MIKLETGDNLLKEDGGKLAPGLFVDYKFLVRKRDGDTFCKVLIRTGTGDTSDYKGGFASVLETIEETISGEQTDAQLRTYYNNKLKDYGDAGYTEQQ